jgi:hypothetical protein
MGLDDEEIGQVTWHVCLDTARAIRSAVMEYAGQTKVSEWFALLSSTETIRAPQRRLS